MKTSDINIPKIKIPGSMLKMAAIAEHFKHKPGGHDHDQREHGNNRKPAKEEPSKPNASKPAQEQKPSKKPPKNKPEEKPTKKPPKKPEAQKPQQKPAQEKPEKPPVVLHQDYPSGQQLQSENEQVYSDILKVKDIGHRKDEWEALSEYQRDQIADAANSIKSRQKQLLGDLPERPNTGDLASDLNDRINQMADRLNPDSADLIMEASTEFGNVLDMAGVHDSIRHKMTLDAMDALAVQEMESCRRQLGDHGIHHIRGNMIMTAMILGAHPNPDTPMDMAIAQATNIYHDMGYLTGPSQNFLDEGHPRWSQTHFDVNVREDYDQAFGAGVASRISSTISTHSSTVIDWDEQPVSSAIRVADNSALFHKDKLPPLFRQVPENLKVLDDFAEEKIDVDEARVRMIENVNNSNLQPKVKQLMRSAAEEVSVMTPKYTLGMLGGTVEDFTWHDDHINIGLRENKENTKLNSRGDFGQRQFGKLAEAFGVKPDYFKTNLAFQFRNSKGKVVLSAEWRKHTSGYRQKHKPGGHDHDQSRHGKPQNLAPDTGGMIQGGTGTEGTKRRTANLVKLIREDGGFTYDVNNRSMIKRGLVVSNHPELEKRYKGAKITPRLIEGFLNKNRKDRKLFSEDKNAFMGAWYNTEDDMVYLDVVTVVQDHDTARGFAQRFNQESYYSLHEGKEYRVQTHDEAERRRQERTGKSVSEGKKRRIQRFQFNRDATPKDIADAIQQARREAGHATEEE